MAETDNQGKKCSVEGCGAYATKASGYKFCFQHDDNPKVSELRALARSMGGAHRKIEASLTSDSIKAHPILNRTDLLWLLNMALVDITKLGNTVKRAQGITNIARTLDAIVVREDEVNELREEIVSLKRRLGIDVEVEAEEV